MSFGSVKVLKGLKKMHFMALKKSRKHSDFRIYSYFKDSAFTAVKGMQSFKLGMRKGYHLSIES